MDDGSLRLIYNGISATPDSSDLAHSYAVGYPLYNISWDDPKNIQVILMIMERIVL